MVLNMHSKSLMSQRAPQIHCDACGGALPADSARARYCLECDLIVCQACWKSAASRCTSCAAAADSSRRSKRSGESVSLRTARRADRRLREAAKAAALLAGDGTDAQVAQVNRGCLAIKAAIAERVGLRALRRLTGSRFVRARPLGDRMRRHAAAAHAQLGRAHAMRPMVAAEELGPSAPVFRELHGPTLHGFALLLTLGDQAMAEELAANALAAGAARAREHELAGEAPAWLRHSVLRDAKRRHSDTNYEETIRRAALEALGVDRNAFAALNVLTVLERAAIVASSVEGLAQRDVATVLGLNEERSQRIVRDALRRATRAAIAHPLESDAGGRMVTRIREIAAQALA